MINVELSAPQADAVLAGLRLLQHALVKTAGHFPVAPNDGEIGDILTCFGDHDGLDVAEIDNLCEEINRAAAVA